ncbi:MAG: hypothetical protein IPP78_14980 [Holophagaceae bacterium]|nr:hypothetical protein [Holophagaceae bacterium]
MKRILISIGLVCGLPAFAQTSTIYNPGGPSLAGFPSSAPGWVLDFNTMAWGDQASATLQVYGIKRYRDCPVPLMTTPTPKATPTLIGGGCVYYNLRTDLFSLTTQLPPDTAVNTPVLIDQAQALSLGLTQQQLSDFFTQDPADAYISAKLYKSYISTGTPVTFQYTKQGTAVILASFPTAGTWLVSVLDSHHQAKGQLLNITAPGTYGVQVNNVYAGNVRVTLSTPTTGAYFRQEPIVVRGSSTAGAGVTFATNFNDPNRFRIKHLSLGQGSQDENGAVPLLAGKDAMVRLMLEDLKGEFIPGYGPGNTPLQVQLEMLSPGGSTTTTLGLFGSSKAIETGTSYSGSTIPPAVVPGLYVTPGLLVRVRLLNPQGTVIDVKEISPQIVAGRTIHIYPFNIYPGSTYANTAAELQAKIAVWIEERFPMSQIVIHPFGSIANYGGLLRNGYTFMENVLNTMNYIALMNNDRTSANGNIYVGIIDKQYISQGLGYAGLASYGNPGIAMFAQDNYGPQEPGHVLAHEMAHCFNIHHTPSPGAGSPDTAYPYSGNGLCAGYGFSKGFSYFNREIDQYRDLMSYARGIYSYFSDYNFRMLLGNVGTASTFAPVSMSNASSKATMNLPRNGKGTYVMGKKALEAFQKWQAEEAPKPSCWLPDPLVLGEQGEIFQRVPLGSGSGHLLLPAFSIIGPASLTKPGMIPIFEAEGVMNPKASAQPNENPWLVIDPKAE